MLCPRNNWHHGLPTARTGLRVLTRVPDRGRPLARRHGTLPPAQPPAETRVGPGSQCVRPRLLWGTRPGGGRGVVLRIRSRRSGVPGVLPAPKGSPPRLCRRHPYRTRSGGGPLSRLPCRLRMSEGLSRLEGPGCVAGSSQAWGRPGVSGSPALPETAFVPPQGPQLRNLRSSSRT